MDFNISEGREENIQVYEPLFPKYSEEAKILRNTYEKSKGGKWFPVGNEDRLSDDSVTMWTVMLFN